MSARWKKVKVVDEFEELELRAPRGAKLRIRQRLDGQWEYEVHIPVCSYSVEVIRSRRTYSDANAAKREARDVAADVTLGEIEHFGPEGDARHHGSWKEAA